MNRPLLPGEPAPWFIAPALGGNPAYAFDTVAGRWILMLFPGTAACEEALKLVADNRDLFDDDHACFFGISVDRTDAEQGRIAQQLPGIRWLLDYDRSVSASFGAMVGGEQSYPPFWIALDPMMRVCLRGPMEAGPRVLAEFRRLTQRRFEVPAPVLVVPGVLPVESCQLLIALYKENGGRESGFMREIDGVTRKIVDSSHKRRSDFVISDERLIGGLKRRLFRALCPMIKRAFQFEPTRIERFIVACYDAKDGGHFRAHRDNTTKGTAHRKFAVTINLDTSSYDGGDLCFPEFGPQTYRAPTGGAVVFSCSLLHEARPVTRGTRYAFLPFLYDDEGARLREQNLQFVTPDLQRYRSGLASELAEP